MDFRIEEMPAITPNENPFEHDPYHMGGENEELTLMFARFEHNEYCILVHVPTGRRIRIILPKPDCDGKHPH